MLGTVLKPRVHGAFERILKPNITGTVHDMYGGVNRYGVGAFSETYANVLTMVSYSGDNVGTTRLVFNSSASSSIYDGTTVQPAAVQTLMIIRT